MKNHHGGNNRRNQNDLGKRNERPVFPNEAKRYQAQVGVILDIIKFIGIILLALVCLCRYLGKKTDRAISINNNTDKKQLWQVTSEKQQKLSA